MIKLPSGTSWNKYPTFWKIEDLTVSGSVYIQEVSRFLGTGPFYTRERGKVLQTKER